MLSLLCRQLWCLPLLLLVASGASAQPLPEQSADARLQLGPLALDPRLAVRNVGVDTNVFNDADAPVRDLTATFGPEVDSWIRVGRLSWSGTSSVVFNYYRDAESQRSVDLGQTGRLGVDLGYIRPFATGTIARERQRPNLEIDARVKHDTRAAAGGLDVLFSARTQVSVEYGYREFRFDEATLAGASLAQELNREETTATVSGQFVLTPLTTVLVAGETRQDRFRYATERDSDSVRVTAGLQLRPLALVSGRAVVGVRQFEPRSALFWPFTGPVADVELAYQIRDLTRFVGTVQRDLDYSFEPSQAYYVSTGMRLSVVQAIGGRWDVVTHVGRTVLAYRARRDAAGLEASRRDRVRVLGLGLGYRFASDVRVGLELEYASRASSVRRRTYDGLRGGGTFSYGF